MKNTATFDKQKVYRYSLTRQLKPGKNFVNFILLNPSTADEKTDDRTVSACKAFAEELKYDGLYITNLFAFRTKDPEKLKKAKSPIGPDNDKNIKEFAKKSKLVIVAWGNDGTFLERDKAVLSILDKICVPHCLAITSKKCPGHPLYLRRTSKPKKF